jgi:hypothetical protein
MHFRQTILDFRKFLSKFLEDLITKLLRIEKKLNISMQSLPQELMGFQKVPEVSRMK